jgi:ABC-type dipeptide/oligopeptide/nickel transport system permease component
VKGVLDFTPMPTTESIDLIILWSAILLVVLGIALGIAMAVWPERP